MKRIFIFLSIFIIFLTLSSCENTSKHSSDVSEVSNDEVSNITTTKKYLSVVSTGVPYKVSSAPGESYPDINGSELTDGKFSTDGSFFGDAFSGWATDELTVTLDLEKNYDELVLFEMGYLCTDEAGIKPPKEIAIEVSEDGLEWVKVGNAVLPSFANKSLQKGKLQPEVPLKGRYVKVTYKGEASWLFIDEISISANITTSNASIKSASLKMKDNPSLPMDFNFKINSITGKITSEKVYIFPKDTELFFTFEHDGESIVNGGVTLGTDEGFLLSRSDKITLIGKDGGETGYTIDLGDNYGLPIVRIKTDNSAQISTNLDYTTGSVTVLSPDGNNLYNLPMQIRVRGNSTRSHPKLAYRIKLDQKEDILEMGSAKNWVLLANHSDKSLLRNFTAFNLARMFDDLKFTPELEPCEVYLNGSYIGLYTIGEQIQIQENRVAIDEDNADIDTGYLLECDVRAAEEDRPYFDVSGLLFSLIDPDPPTDAKLAYITDYVKNIDKMLREKDESVWDFLDMASCVDWLLAKEICGATGMGYDAYMYKDKGEKLKFGPVWDYDLAFGNADFGGAERYDRFYLCEGQWMALWLEYDSFREEFFKEWERAKTEYIPEMIKGLWEDYEYLSEAAEQNFKKWDILKTYVWPNPESVMKADTFRKQVEQVEWYITKHTEWMNNEFKQRYGYSGN